MSNNVKNSLSVSFIIPAYNAADTIERCLDSIYALSLKREEFEVIVIDDCSSDNTVKIIEDLEIENLMLLCQKKNHRQGAARNRGIKVANGEYICFVDSDDVVTEGIVDAIRLARKKHTDMTAYHIGYADSTGKITREEAVLSYDKDEMFSGMDLQKKHPWWFSGPVAYIYYREFIGKVNYPFAEEVLYEDADFVMAHIFYASRMAYSPHLGYVAYSRDGSTTHSMTHRNITDFVLLGLRMLSLYDRMMCDVQKEVVETYAEDMLDGACWNIYISAKRLIKLESVREVLAFYERLDVMADREAIYSDNRLHKYYWNIWTTICMKHKNIAMIGLACLIPIYKIIKK